MTVSKLHEYMTEKVVPESVMPQNIAACLMDEDEVAVPELDAYTFLNRVRALGIGSADFLYLMEGCGAPEAAVAKIKNNPAMNLQSLIVTLEESGLTSQDYTRMLYTARQIWERTLTMRLEKAQMQEQQTEEKTPVAEEAPVAEKEEFTVSIPREEIYPEASSAAQTSAEDEYDEVDTSDDVQEEAPAYSDVSDEDELYEYADPQDEDVYRDVVADITDDDDEDEETEDETEYDEYDEDEDEDDEEPAPRYADVQEGRTGYQRIPREEKKTSHKGCIAAGAVGSAALIALSVGMSVTGFGSAVAAAPKAAYAADNTQIFAAVYDSYAAGVAGGASLLLPSDSDAEVFGTLLITGDEQLGVYNLGDSAFAATPELITVYTEKSAAVSVKCTIAPPEGAQFIDIVCTKELLAAVFADEDSVGIAAYDEDGSVKYTCHQLGTITDICTGKADRISFGTVYTPRFTESFSAERTDKYLPLLSAAGEVSTVPVQRVVLPEDSLGYSYAVYAEFDLTDGSLTDTAAALGDPVYSDAEQFMAVMKNAEGYDIILRDDSEESKLQTTRTASLIACDMGNTVMAELADDAEPFDSTPEFERVFNVIATAEKQEDGSTTLFLRGFGFEPVSAVTNIPVNITDIRMQDASLYICDENGVAMVLDISDVTLPVIRELTAAHGVISDSYALCSSYENSIMKYTLYHCEDNILTEVRSSSKKLTLPEDELPQLSGTNTFFIDGERRCAAACSYFDGVSVVSEYTLFGMSNTSYTLFDDKNGFTAGVQLGDRLHLVYGGNSIVIG